jgi:hypothetical protein
MQNYGHGITKIKPILFYTNNSVKSKEISPIDEGLILPEDNLFLPKFYVVEL